MANYNPWSGCRLYSAGCQNCYFYGSYYGKERNLSIIEKSPKFNSLIEKNKNGSYKIKSGQLVYLSFNSDFFLQEADIWRNEVWEMIKFRNDLKFLFLTKRIDRFYECIPADWEAGYEYVSIGCTCESQEILDYRLPIFLSLPIKHRFLVLTPILSEINLNSYDLTNKIEGITVGGESGINTRVCNYDWILRLREVAIKYNISFWFKQTGTKFIKENVLYNIPNKLQHKQAREANININLE